MRVQVYPEYYCGELQGDGIEIYGKRTSDRKSRMFLSVNGKIKNWYDKICSDGNEPGDPDQDVVVWTTDSTALGLICCMDVDAQLVNEESLNTELWLDRVKSKLDISGCHYKIICISACMSASLDWFPGGMLPRQYNGYIVVLSNGDPDGIRSFIAGPDRVKLNNLTVNIGGLSISSNGCA